jgi:hypothetical protein
MPGILHIAIRHSELRRLAELVVSLGSQLKAIGGERPAVSRHTQRPQPRNRTAEMALLALRTHGRLQRTELLGKIRGMGWKGTGDDRKDQDSIYAALHRRPDAAINCGGGIWAARNGGQG